MLLLSWVAVLALLLCSLRSLGRAARLPELCSTGFRALALVTSSLRSWQLSGRRVVGLIELLWASFFVL